MQYNGSATSTEPNKLIRHIESLKGNERKRQLAKAKQNMGDKPCGITSACGNHEWVCSEKKTNQTCDDCLDGLC